MATLVAYLASGKYAPVTVVSGGDIFLQQRAVDAAVARTGYPRTATQRGSIRNVEEHLALRSRTVVYEPPETVAREALAEALVPLLEPAPDAAAVIVFAESHVPFLRGAKRVVHVDLPKVLRPDQLVKLLIAEGLAETVAGDLVERCDGDAERVFELLEKLRLAAKPWSPQLFNLLAPRRTREDAWLTPYDILPDSPENVCRQFEERFRQFTLLAAVLTFQSDPLLICRQTEIERPRLGRYLRLVRGTSPQFWLERLRFATLAVSYARRGFTEAPIWLKAACGLTEHG